jgi:hypothetical protein
MTDFGNERPNRPFPKRRADLVPAFARNANLGQPPRLRDEGTSWVTTFACDLHVFASGIPTNVATILLTLWNFALAWDMCTLGFLLICHQESPPLLDACLIASRFPSWNAPGCNLSLAYSNLISMGEKALVSTSLNHVKLPQAFTQTIRLHGRSCGYIGVPTFAGNAKVGQPPAPGLSSVPPYCPSLPRNLVVHRGTQKQVPRLRIAIEKANRNGPLGMADFGEVSLGLGSLGRLSS